MTREPSFGSPASQHTLLHLQETVTYLMNKICVGADIDLALRFVAIAAYEHDRQLMKEQKP